MRKKQLKQKRCCIVCLKNAATHPDRTTGKRTIKLCVNCYTKRLVGDLKGIASNGI